MLSLILGLLPHPQNRVSFAHAVEKPEVNTQFSKAWVKLHLQLHSFNCAGTLRWLRLTHILLEKAQDEQSPGPNGGIILRTRHEAKGSTT